MGNDEGVEGDDVAAGDKRIDVDLGDEIGEVGGQDGEQRYDVSEAIDIEFEQKMKECNLSRKQVNRMVARLKNLYERVKRNETEIKRCAERAGTSGDRLREAIKVAAKNKKEAEKYFKRFSVETEQSKDAKPVAAKP